MKTIAIIIGVSKYKSPIFGSLPGAAHDARRVAQSFTSWGLYPENIRLLIDEEATRSEILHSLRVWPLKKHRGNIRIIVFFSGHGSRIQEIDRPACSVLLTYDTDPADRIGTGVLLSEIISALSRIKPLESFLFFDACSLRFDNIENVLPSKLPDADILRSTDSNCMFCIVAAGLDNSYEHEKSRSGYFTDSFLRQIAELRHLNTNCNTLAVNIKEDLKLQNLPQPECYLIGNPNCWLLPNTDLEIKPDSSEVIGYDLVYRYESLAVLQDILVKTKGEPIWLYAKSGAGKTVLVQQLSMNTSNCTYCSVPDYNDILHNDISSYITFDIADQLPNVFPSARPLSGDPLNTLNYIENNLPGLLLIIDHMERLPFENQIDLLESLKNFQFYLLFVSRYKPNSELNVFSWELPLLSDNEVKLFYEKYGSDCELSVNFLKTASNGVPLKLRKLLTNNVKTPLDFFDLDEYPNLLDTIKWVYLCGGYVDEDLFRMTFEVDSSDLSKLEEMGLILFNGDHYLAHDSLIEFCKNNLKIEQTNDTFKKIFKYWSGQIEIAPQNLWACRKFVNLIITHEYSVSDDKTIFYALETLVKIRDWNTVEAVGIHLLKKYNNFSSVALFAAEELIHIARYDAVDRITSTYKKIKLKDNDFAKILLIESERSFWYGNYDLSIDTAKKIQKYTSNHEIIGRSHLNIGIAYFFQGKWKAAIAELTLIDDLSDTRTIAWSKMILGTIYGLRGTDIVTGRILLHSSIRLLSQIGDDVGNAIAWNNLGEMTWKIKDYRSALVQLSTGLDYAKAVGDKPTQLEVIRNLIHVRLRYSGINSSELDRLIEIANELLDQVNDKTEQMQVWNTLATVSAYRNELKLLKRYIDLVHPITKGNSEYHIYTLANKSLKYALELNNIAYIFLKRAINLAMEGNNYCAILQIYTDVFEINKLYQNHLTKTMLKSFKQYLRNTETNIPDFIRDTIKSQK